jgi:hypothetical protein
MTVNVRVGSDGGLESASAATTITVTPAGQGGDYNSVKAANDSITDASASKPYGIVVYPGVFTEAPITLKPYVAITALVRGAAVVAASNNASPLFTFDTFCTLKDLTIQGPTASSAIYVPAGKFNCQAENIQVNSGLTAFEATGASASLLIEGCKAFPSVTNCVVASSGARIDGSSVLTYASGIAFYANGGTIWLHNSGGVGNANGLYADNGGSIYPHNVTFENTTSVMRTGTTGTNLISGNSVVSRGTSTLDVWQQASGSTISVVGCALNASKFVVADWAGIFLSYDGEEQGEELAQFTQDFVCGVPEAGRHSHLGRGVPYTRGMAVITTDSTATATTDGGNLTDVSAAARSPSGSTFTFQGTAAWHTILIGSELSDGSDVLKHWGLYISQTTAAVEATKRSFAFELWNGTAWVEKTVMDVSEPELYRYANEVFIRANSTELIQYGVDTTTTWAKKTISGKNLYWARIRIKTAVTTRPVFEQFRLLPSHMYVFEDGSVAYVGRARFTQTLAAGGNVFGGIGSTVDGSINVGTGGAPTGWSHEIKQSVFNGNGDGLDWQTPIPLGADTGYPVYMDVVLIPASGGAGTVTMRGSILPLEVAGNLEADPTGGITPVARTLANTETTTAKAAQTNTQTYTSGTTDKMQKLRFGPFNLSNYYEGDLLCFYLEMSDDGAGNADTYVMTLSLTGARWANGGRF